ncbi:7883_t:CDS:1, partial [Racocetra fulgida]
RAVKEYDNDTSEDLDEQLASYVLDHLIMRKAYEKDVQTAKDSDRSFRTFSFDFAQNVKMPYDP